MRRDHSRPIDGTCGPTPAALPPTILDSKLLSEAVEQVCSFESTSTESILEVVSLPLTEKINDFKAYTEQKPVTSNDLKVNFFVALEIHVD